MTLLQKIMINMKIAKEAVFKAVYIVCKRYNHRAYFIYQGFGEEYVNSSMRKAEEFEKKLFDYDEL